MDTINTMGTTQTPSETKPINVTPKDSELREKMKGKFGFFGPAILAYSVLYAFCMFKNTNGIAFPFFIAGSVWFIYYSFLKLGRTLKKGSGFYLLAMGLLAISTFLTEDLRIVFFNKTGIFLLTIAVLLKQFYDTEKWDFTLFVQNILSASVLTFFENIAEPVRDLKNYLQSEESEKHKSIYFVLLGALMALPLLIVVIALLSQADVVFNNVMENVFNEFNIPNMINIVFRIVAMFFFTYAILAGLCKEKLRSTPTDKRKGEPLIALTVNIMLSLVYALFCGIQIMYLFMGNMQLPDGYTYAGYAREGFFQLLAVSFLNLVIVLISLGLFKESKLLKGVLTFMSLCTFVMIASSAIRMIMYIQCYHLTFLRILVLWSLALLTLLFVGIVISILKSSFPLFRYGMVVVSVMYIGLAFSHPDYLIAKVNIEQAEAGGEMDYSLLRHLCLDAAPVVLDYMKDQGYSFERSEGVGFIYDHDENPNVPEANYNRMDSLCKQYSGKIMIYEDTYSLRKFNVSGYCASNSWK